MWAPKVFRIVKNPKKVDSLLPVFFESPQQVLHAVLVDIAKLPLGSGVTSQRGPVHNAANVFLDWPSGEVVHEDSKPHPFRPANLLETSIGSQGVFKGEGALRRDMAVDKLPELFP